MFHYKIYCAGPLFNPKEQEEMASIANSLEEAGYSVFLPQRDGLEFAQIFPALISRDVPSDMASKILNMAIFDLDVYQVMDRDGLVLNMNGRVPDEGAMVEAGIAWSHDKQIVIFKNDTRSLVYGNCNPLVLGLSGFEFISDYKDIPKAFNEKFSNAIQRCISQEDSASVSSKNNGSRITEYLVKKKSITEITDLLIELFGEGSCKNLTIQDQK